MRFADFESGMPRTESWIKDRDYVVADTGDDFDDRFDTVIRVEDLTYDHAGRLHISISEPLQKGQFVNPRGALLRPGELLVRAGATIRPLHLGLLAAGGVREVQVVKKPLVAFIPSGNELVPPGVEPGEDRTWNPTVSWSRGFCRNGAQKRLSIRLSRPPAGLQSNG